MNTISFMTANFVARELDYNMPGGWGQGDKATNDAFAPPASFAARFGAMLDEITAAGFNAIDLWMAHLNFTWATAEQIATAKRLLDARGLRVASLAGWFGKDAAEFAQVCRLATALDCHVLGGGSGAPREQIIALLAQHDLVLALENHPEKTPADLLARIGDDGQGRIGACVDTGWFGTQGYDAAEALLELQDSLLHVHLKDVYAPTQPNEHRTSPFGEGIVDVAACVQMLQKIGYSGAISIEHEPEQGNPLPAVRAGATQVRAWLNQPA